MTSNTRIKWKSAAAKRLLKLAGEASSVEHAVQLVVGRVLEGISHPPVPLDALLPKLDISEIKYEEIPFSGELRVQDGKYQIICSAHLSPARRRFTVAHEMAHALLELSGPGCPKTGLELERLCDMLATEFLMPREMFITHAGTDLTIERIFKLVGTFKTSLSATAIRCAELLNLSIFEVEGDRVIWGYGYVRKGTIQILDSDLRRVITEALVNRTGSSIIPLVLGGKVRHCNIQYGAAGKNRILFILRLISNKALSPKN